MLGIKLCQLLQSYSLVASRLLCGDFVGGEITLNPYEKIGNCEQSTASYYIAFPKTNVK